MTAYYNEYDSHAAAWLRELIKQGLIADGVVDERSIIDVQANDLDGFSQCHFFAGIGGWSYALRLANWSDNRPVWTASLPCQPFSVAGKQQGKADERHLLPHFLELVRQCRPITLFGEQVEGAVKHGWLDDLHSEMDAEGYTTGVVVLGAHSAGSFHQRQRLYWVAHTNKLRQQGQGQVGRQRYSAAHKNWQVNRIVGISDISNSGIIAGLGNAESAKYKNSLCSWEGGIRSSRASATGRMGNTDRYGRTPLPIPSSDVQPSAKRWQNRQNVSSESSGTSRRNDATSLSGCESGRGEWDNPDWIYCRDGKYRPILAGLKPIIRAVKSGVTALVNGVSERVVHSGGDSESINANETKEARVMRLRGYGNAICPQTAAMFIEAFMETQNDALRFDIQNKMPEGVKL